MTLLDLKYITQENIDKACIDASSSEIFAEAENYNRHMSHMRIKRRSFMRDYIGLVTGNVIFTGIGLVDILSLDFDGFSRAIGYTGSLLYKLTDSILCAFIPWLVFVIAFMYFVVARHIYKWQFGLLFAVLLIPASNLYIFPSAANIIMLYIMEKKDSAIRDEVGYPHFIPLTVNVNTAKK